ncbi:MAG: prepilin peptidase [Patescibacteria group bacterium]
MFFSLAYFFVFGLIIGSFLNVLIIRLRDAETILGRSFCRSCKHQIRWYDNIPLVSFILLRGTCRDCEEKISWQYPVIEAVTGILFALIGYFFFSWSDPRAILETVWLLGLVSILITLSVYDIRHLEIPVSLLIIGVVWTFLFLCIHLFFFEYGLPLWWTRLALGVFGGLVVGFFFFCLVWFSKETWMGWGDVWLGMLAGLVVGLRLSFFMLTLSFVLGAVIGITLLVFSKKSLKTQIPFGPFLALGILLTLVLSQAVPDMLRFFLY